MMSERARFVLRQPQAFLLQVLRAFWANRGLLLAGAVAYYALMSMVPLIILSVIALSHFVDQAELVYTLNGYIARLIPSQSRVIMGELQEFLDHRAALGGMLTVTMLFFSAQAFSVLEQAMAAIFNHRVAQRSRHILVSALLPYCYVLLLGIGLLLVTLVSGLVQMMGTESVTVLGRSWSLNGVSVVLLWALGLGGEVFILASIYLVMPVGRLAPRHAVIGALIATLMWEVIRLVLVWYFTSMSQVGVVYGSLTAFIVVLLSLEVAAGLVLFGAQVISIYERLDPKSELAQANLESGR